MALAKPVVQQHFENVANAFCKITSNIIRSIRQIRYLQGVVPANHSCSLLHDDPELMANAGIGVGHDQRRQNEDEPNHITLVERPPKALSPVSHTPEGFDANSDFHMNLIDETNRQGLLTLLRNDRKVGIRNDPDG